MSKGCFSWQLDLAIIRERILARLWPFNNLTKIITNRIYHSSCSSFIAIYIIITSSLVPVNGYKIHHIPSPGGRFLLNFSVDSLPVWKDHSVVLPEIRNLPDYVPSNSAYGPRERHDPRTGDSWNQHKRRVKFERADKQRFPVRSYAQSEDGPPTDVRPGDISFPSRETWSDNELHDKEKMTAEDIFPSQPYKVLNPALIQTYRAANPCLRYDTHWVRNDDACSIFFVCARHEVSAVLSCPNNLVWSNRVTNCVPINSRWDDCTSRTNINRSRKRRRKKTYRRFKRIGHRPVPALTTTALPVTSTTEQWQETSTKSVFVKRIYRRRKLRIRHKNSSILNKSEKDKDHSLETSNENNDGLKLHTGIDDKHVSKSLPSSSSPPPLSREELGDKRDRKHRFKSRKRVVSKRRRLNDHSRHFRSRQKDLSRKKWFIDSSAQNETQTERRVRTDGPRRISPFPKRKGHRKRYRLRKQERRNNREMMDLKHHVIHEQSIEIKNDPQPDYPTKAIEPGKEDNNIPARWWKDTVTLQTTTMTTSAAAPVNNDTNMAREKQLKKGHIIISGRNSTRQNFVPECGVSSTSLIVGGLPISHDRWPWLASLQLSWSSRHVCGGTLVHPQWLITAAHCVADPDFSNGDDWRVVFGDIDSVVEVDFILKHPDFVNDDNYPNDIALLRLRKPTDVSGFKIRHACIPADDWSRADWEKCWIMGWGEAKETFKNDLKELEVDIWKNAECSARWGWKRILNSHVCVGNGDSGACNGDSGGPLICRRDGYHFLTGVTSWGVSGCQTLGYPSVFTKVAYYKKWIRDVIDTYTAKTI